jgi:Zn-finger nucleic acid-binding protein
MERDLLIACTSCHRQYDVSGMKRGDRVRCQCGELMLVPEQGPHVARIIHCSSCGGKLQAKATRCEYCGGEITVNERNLGPACPECFARLRAGAGFCSECGVKIEPEALRAIRASARCPRCKGSLLLREVSGGHLTECGGCGGIWLDSKQFERILQEKDATSIGGILARSRPETRDDSDEKVRYIPCPICGNLMNRKNFASCSGVIIDWCRGHGFWFDGDELEKVIDFIRSGGLAEARRIDIERAKRDLARLEERKRTVAAGTGHAGWPGGGAEVDVGPALADAFWTLVEAVGTLLGGLRR